MWPTYLHCHHITLWEVIFLNLHKACRVFDVE
eukprot:SAG25_NODE_1012_length_4300_cov_2.456082_4_plen_32_part_00